MSFRTTNEKKLRAISLVRELISNNEFLYFSRRLTIQDEPDPVYEIGTAMPKEHYFSSGILLTLRLGTREFPYSFSTEGWDDLLYYFKDKLEASINTPQFSAHIDNGRGEIEIEVEVSEVNL